MNSIKVDTSLIAKCGLYCGACRAFLSSKCPGCIKNEKASWCKLRACCIENSLSTCADCGKVDNTNNCKIFNNFISKIFAFIFRSDRNACIEQIKKCGLQKHAELMALGKSHTIKCK